MADDRDPPKNPFVRWKQHVDTHIGLTLNGLLGIPAMVTKNLNIRREPGSEGAAGAGATSAAAPTAPTPADTPADKAEAGDGAAGGGDGSGVLDGVDAAQLLEWHKFMYYSPYSPLQLQQDQQRRLLPPPVPRDVPFGADPYAFTYADAFEDLLRASSRRPLLDLTERSYRNLRYQLRYGSAVEPPYVFFHRMHGQNLLEAYFPRASASASASASAAAGSAPAKAAAETAAGENDSVVRAVTALAERERERERQRDLWQEQREEEEEAEAAAHDSRDLDEAVDLGRDDSSDPFARRRAARRRLWNQVFSGGDGYADADDKDDAMSPRRRAGFGGGGGTLFDELDRAFRVLGRIIDDDDDDDEANPSSAADASKKPDVEDELYTALRSAYTGAEKSLSTLINAVAGSFDAQGRADVRTSMAKSVTDGGDRAAGAQDGETIETKEEHVDAFGNRHIKTVVRRLDADGREVARETRYTIRSPSAQDAAAAGGSTSTSTSTSGALPAPAEKASSPAAALDEGEGGSKKTGWFWK